MWRWIQFLSVAMTLITASGQVTPDLPRQGIIKFQPEEHEQDVSNRFRLSAHEFSFEENPLGHTLDSIQVSTVTFPSPLETPHLNNNTVHCEFFRAKMPGKRPGVVVLHIMGADFELSRLCCRALAESGTSALFVKLPYYGPRRQPETGVQMISFDPRQTVRGMTQAVLDVRHAVAWLCAQDQIDQEQIGIAGISLGGIVSSLAITAEPRLTKACLVLAGGDIDQVSWDAPEVSKVRLRWIELGGTQDSLLEILRHVDPVRYAKKLADCQILMLNAKYDEIIPRACTESLWRAFGQPEIVWWNAGHFSAVIYLPEGINRMVRFFRDTKDP